MPSSYYLEDFEIKNKKVFIRTISFGTMCIVSFFLYQVL